MKNKSILIFSVLLLLVVVVYMAKDLFYSPPPNPDNPYEYNIEKFKEADPSLICYEEYNQIKPETEVLYAIAMDGNDHLYVSGKEVLFIYDKKYRPLNTINLTEDVYCMAIDEDGMLYLGMADHVEIRKADGTLVDAWESMGEDAIFTAIAVNETSVFVADAGNKVVYHYNKSGKLLNRIGEKDPEAGRKGFIIPSPYFDLLLGRQNELWVVNPGLHRFEAYRPDGTLISSWEKTSMQWDGFSGCCNPSHIAMLSDGSFVTSEKGIERVKIHHPNGDLKCIVATPDMFIEGTTDLDLAVDSGDRIFIMDKEMGLIRMFDKNEQ